VRTPYRSTRYVVKIWLLLGGYSLLSNTGYLSAQPSASPPAVSTTLTIDPARTYQTIAHFGASDAWSCQFVGQWPDAKKNAIADLLFSRDTLASGQPKGIGLSIWRFNIGAGTAEQGAGSGIGDEWRRAESFLNNDGTYDWNKQAGQLWFLQAAKQRGVTSFLAFPNSPPVQYTLNGKGYASNKVPNLSAEKFDQYGQFMAAVVAGVRTRTGITFDYISPVNEPQWDWSDGGQEGTPFYNNQIAGITRSLSKALTDKQLPTKISIAEAGQIDFLYGDNGRQGKGTQISAFFDKTSADYLGNLANLTSAISYHSYFTTSPYSAAVTKRQQVAATTAGLSNLGIWMSEYCILGDNGGEINGSGKDLGIDPAVYIAKVIHNDLVNANASAWHWWLAITPYNYKDGLIYIDKNKTDGSYQPAKMLWAMGNFSRFVRPGAVRVHTTLSQDNNGLLASAYRNTDGQLVMVIINSNPESQTVATTLASGKLTSLTTYTTSATADLSRSRIAASANSLTIPGKSVVTLVGKLTM
jgi:O-glycosyl hydrolase